MPNIVNVDTVSAPTRADLQAAYLTASLEGRYQDAVDAYKALASC